MNLSNQLYENAKLVPEKTAYVFGDDEVTYKELDEQVSRFAHQLTEMGIKKGDHVGIFLGNCPQYVISLYGTLRAGAIAIPVNPIYTPEEMSYLLSNGDVKAVVVLEQLVPLFEKLHHSLPMLNSIIYINSLTEDSNSYEQLSIYPKMKPFSALMIDGNPSHKGPSLHENDTAVILYTSGTTGKPKGAMLTHRNLYSNAKDTADYLTMDQDDKVIATLPMFHVFCLTVALNAPLMNLGTVIIVPKFQPNEIFNIAKKHGATIFAGVPTMYNFLLQFPNGNVSDFNTIRLCISGGASMPVALLKNFEKKFDVMVSEGYGLSEAAPVTCFNPLDRPRKPGSIGKNILNVENKVVNELGEEVRTGQVGELIVKGPNVMKGYYKMPEESQATIKEGWLYTGDLATQDDEGYFYIVDRKKDMIIVGGYNVYPREVEEVFYDHPDVVEAAVIGEPDPDFGERVKCFVVLKNTLSKEELITYCSQRLAKYKIPSSIEFLDELPKNTTGKILRRALKKQLSNS